VSIRHNLKNVLKRRGLVIGLSGGIDSSVTAVLAVRALGRERVFALEMPERDSSPQSGFLSRLLIEHLGIESLRIDITPILEAVDFYRSYENAVRAVIPEYSAGWRSKIVTSGIFEHRGFRFFSLVAESPDNRIFRVRLPLKPYLEIVAATNFKQRTRKMLEYYHADRLNYAVAGTPNRLEYDQGFFVKLGDGAADLKPIAHLYKTQVFQLAEYLGVPEAIRNRTPTSDTYSLEQGQDEFYFSLPYHLMDLCLYGKNLGMKPCQVAPAVGLSPEQVQTVFNDIDSKRSATHGLHLYPILCREIPEITQVTALLLNETIAEGGDHEGRS
jgi:NAD+ synthase